MAAPAEPPPTGFDWTQYADATFAGLSLLIPIPLLDSAFEWFFRRRIPAAVARHRGRRLDPVVVAELNRDDQNCLEQCLLFPLWLTWYLLKKISKKILYFLTVKEATDQLSRYWHRAFLIDYALQRGHLDDLRSAQVARQAIQKTLKSARTSPLEQLARNVVASPRNVLRSLRRARKGQEDELIRQKRSLIARTWDNFGDYLGEVAVYYDQAHAQALAAREAAEAAEAERRAAAEAEAQRKTDES